MADKQTSTLTPIYTPVFANLFVIHDVSDTTELKSVTWTQIKDLVQSNFSAVPQSAITNMITYLKSVECDSKGKPDKKKLSFDVGDAGIMD